MDRLAAFQQSDWEYLELISGKPRLIRAKQPIVQQGESCGFAPLIVKGWVTASKQLQDGRWQTLSVFIEGDLCNYGAGQFGRADHTLQALTDVIALDIRYEQIAELMVARPRLGHTLQRSGFIQSAIAHERLLSLGQRKAKEHCAHLICELFWRLRAAGVVKEGAIDFPLTQEGVGSIIGVSTVHANRMLQDLRLAGLIEQSRRRLAILDLERLESVALFAPSYLHLDAQNFATNRCGKVGNSILSKSSSRRSSQAYHLSENA